MTGGEKTRENRDKAQGGAASRSPARTPSCAPSPPPERGRSLVRRGGNEIVVHEHVIRESHGGGNIIYPTLTSTNYIEWALVMKMNLRTVRPSPAWVSRVTARTWRRCFVRCHQRWCQS